MVLEHAYLATLFQRGAISQGDNCPTPQMAQCGLEVGFGGGVCVIVWKSREIHHYQGVNMYNTSCLTAAPPLYDRIKSHAVISKLDTGELNQNYADTAVHHVT